jgi:hypothetical protein
METEVANSGLMLFPLLHHPAIFHKTVYKSVQVLQILLFLLIFCVSEVNLFLYQVHIERV